MVVGDGDGSPADLYARTASRGGSVSAVVFGLVVGQRRAADGTILRGAAPVVDVGLLDARVAAGVLEGDVIEVDAGVDDAENDARAVVLARETCRDGIRREGQHVVDVGLLARIVGHQFLQR